MMRTKWLFCLATFSGTVTLGCKPEVGEAPSLITNYTLLAVRGEPAEAKPGDNVTYSFVLASPSGPVDESNAGWDVCTTPKPPAENNSVSSACNPSIPGSTAGQTFEASVPMDACRLFGPIAPPASNGHPAVSPRGPDATGGYYLPVRVKLEDPATLGLTGFAFERITCDLANAASNVLHDFNTRYLPNNDPDIANTDLIAPAGTRLSLDAGPQTVAPGDSVVFEATFTPGSAETFPVLDQSGDALVDQTESLHMSWFATAGAFTHDRTGVASDESASSTSNTWTAPKTVMEVYVWLILRDSRGGTATRAYKVLVAPVQ